MSSRMIVKRINREIRTSIKFAPVWLDITLNFIDGDIVRICIQDSALMDVSLKNYPFRPPSIIWHSINPKAPNRRESKPSYLSTMATYTDTIININADPVKKFILNVITNKTFGDVEKTNCLCCQSILCGNRWNPTLTLYDIAKEGYSLTIMEEIDQIDTTKNLFSILPVEVLTLIENYVLGDQPIRSN